MEGTLKDSLHSNAQDTEDLLSSKPVALHPVTDLNLPRLSPNPWNDDLDAATNVNSSEDSDFQRLLTPDPSSILNDEEITAGLHAQPSAPAEGRVEVPKEVLTEFDPLVSQEEKAARDAWETSEAHPPPPRTSSPPVPPLPQKDELNISAPAPTETVASASPSFPSLAALARNFSIPALARARPLSVDIARPVPSPGTLSSFASQQDSPRNDESTAAGPSSRIATPNSSGSGTASPAPGMREKGEMAFDFQKFLDQMKSRNAEPVSKYLRSFLSNFAKRTFTVSDQVKIINDFLNFISVQMRSCDIWKNAPDAEFDNAMEGMEKLVMNRLYDFTFTPQVVHAIPPRPITADDLERDKVLSQRIALFGWLEEKHLDIPEGEGSKGFLMFAQQELLKINHYKAPRDKLICILNCCKVIFGLIRHLRKDEGADSFVPILIYVVLKANPDHLLSNVEFINRFRNPQKLQSEAGYYLSSLMGAVSFIETMDHTSLSNITQEAFEKNVEEAIQALPHSEPPSPAVLFADPKSRLLNSHPHAGEESAQPLSISTPAHPAQTLSEDAKRLLQKTGDTISKPLNAIGRIFTEALDGAENKLSYLPGPFAAFELGREQREQNASSSGPPTVPQWSHPEPWQTPARPAGVLQTPSRADGTYTPPLQTPYKPRVRRASPSYSASPGGSPGFGPEDTPSRLGPQTHQAISMGPSQPLYSQALLPPRVQSLAVSSDGSRISRTPTPNLDLAGVQAEIDSVHEQASSAARDTLKQIFPSVDEEVMEWVLEANGGDLGKSIEGLLEMSSGT